MHVLNYVYPKRILTWADAVVCIHVGPPANHTMKESIWKIMFYWV